jgi:protein tyrosine phosphatase (PTP) superfamily phosphohydrolase (DUF442 family)
LLGLTAKAVMLAMLLGTGARAALAQNGPVIGLGDRATSVVTVDQGVGERTKALAAALGSTTHPTGPIARGTPGFEQIKIKNFGAMDGHFLRGEQPKEAEYRTLANLGVTLIIDLRDDPEPYARRAAEAAGMRYVNIPLSSNHRPTQADADAFMAAVRANGDHLFYAHCKGGIHRTGAMGAVYRKEMYGWGGALAYQEMLRYRFGGHGSIKDFVFDYCDRR